MTTKNTKTPAPVAKVHKLSILDDEGALCGSTSRQRTSFWEKVTCKDCLKREPTGPAKAALSEDELDIALDALRVWAARERDLAMHDAWGDSAGQRQKRAIYDRRIAVANALAKRLGEEVK
jgi:hypothetical protein